MHEWTLGITDSHPASWRSCEPHWQDEKIVASSSHSFYDVMNELCNSAIKNRREYDHGIGEHLWNMKIMSMNEAMNPPSPDERLMRMYDDDSDNSDDSKDGNEESYRGAIIIQCPQDERAGGYEDFDDPDPQIMNSDTKLNSGVLPEGFIIAVTYDYGTTTSLYLKVLKIRSVAVQSLLQYFSMEANTTQMTADLQAVPAYNLSLEQQVDYHFPYASKAFLGYYLPLFKDGDMQDIGIERKVMGSITLGLLSKITSEDDTVFCTMEDRNSSQDLLFCPGVLDLNELLEVVNNAWEPRNRSNDPDHLDRFCYDWISRWIVGANDDAGYLRMKEIIDNDPGFGSKKLLFRSNENHDSKKSSFDFEKVFPKTFAMMSNGKFRWIRYKRGILRVIVGRGKGEGSRECEEKQVIRTWKYDFKSFHEMLCAIEASWVWKGRELTADAVIPEYDADLGPSAPLPKEPTCYGEKDDAVVISKCGDKKKLVTALAVSEEAAGKIVLYSGHDDGTLSKWSLDTNEQIWSKNIYPDGTKDYERYTGGCGLYVKETPGVAGIVVRPDHVKKTRPIIFTWTDAYNGYPSKKFDDREPSVLKAWSGVDGKFICEYVCDVGNDQDGSPAQPSISAVVFCKVFHHCLGCYQDTILVGLHCCCNTLEYDEDYSDFDIEESRQFSEGNILPFLEHSRDKAMETWRGHNGMIRAMAVIREAYVVSVSIQSGCGRPDQMIIWSLEDDGVPLFRKDIYDYNQPNVFKRSLYRLTNVVGICIEGNDILLSDNYGDRIVSATLHDEGEEGPTVTINGYASIGNRNYDGEGFHGRIAVADKYASVAMEIDSTAWIFRIRGNSSHNNLDRRDGNPRDFRYDSYDGNSMESLQQKRAGREMAIGKVKFPPFGGNSPSRKKRKPLDFMGPLDLSCKDQEDGFGEGGPIALAMRGRYIVGGFSNGSLARFFLPDAFAETKLSLCANDRSSCGSLPSDEWHIPILECEDD